MDLSFANPVGFWALLGVPAIVAIHFLQRQSKVLTISTLFLIEQLTRESVRGRKLERLRNSVPLWLQLLMVLGLTWILIEPRWIRAESVQRIALVLDSSASMSVFKDKAIEGLRSELQNLATKVSHTEYVVLDSAIADLSLYNGDNLSEMLASINEWAPHGGAHDFSESLRVARSLVGGDGLVILTTDHLFETLPFNTILLAVGDAEENVGFTGYSVAEQDDGRLAWRCVVRNYSDVPLTRTWSLTSGNQRSPAREINLEASQSLTLEGAFPAGATDVTLRLSGDAFSLDDRLPMVQPMEKPLVIASLTPPALQETIDQVIASLGNVQAFDPDAAASPDAAPSGASGPASAPDLFLYSYVPIRPTVINGDALVFLDVAITAKYLTGHIAAENHPLIAGLNWQGLIARSSAGETPGIDDTVLLWQDKRPLIFLRNDAGRNQLFFNFDLATSNAARLPAFVVMIHRFVETLRAQKIAPMAGNFETGQAIDLTVKSRASEGETSAPPPLRYVIRSLPADNDASTSTSEEIIPLTQASLLRAPSEAGFFSVYQGEQKLLTAAAAFADTREADLRQASSRNDVSSVETSIIEQNSERDSHWQIWLLLMLLTTIVCWYFVEKKQVSADANAEPAPAN